MSYLKMLGLNEEPFSSKESKYFNPSIVEDSYEVLQDSLSNKAGISLVIGDSGSGKSSLLTFLSENSLNEWRLVSLTLLPDISSDEILEQLLGHFHVVVNKNIDREMYHQQMLSALSLRLKELALFKLSPILLVDNSECLTDNSLQTIFALNELNQESEGNLKVVLFGQPEILEIIKQPQFLEKHAMLTVIALENIRQNQLPDYLRHRLRIAGYKHSFPFTDQELEQIYVTSSGNPARINEQADNLLKRKTKDYGSQMETVANDTEQQHETEQLHETEQQHETEQLHETEQHHESELKIAEEVAMAYPGNDPKSDNEMDELAFSIQKQINSFDEVQNLAGEKDNESSDDLAQQLEKELAESQRFLQGDSNSYSFLSPKFLIPGVAILFIFISGATYFLLSDESSEVQSVDGETISQPLALPDENVRSDLPMAAEQPTQEIKSELSLPQNPVVKDNQEIRQHEPADKEIKKIPLIFLNEDVIEVVDTEKANRSKSLGQEPMEKEGVESSTLDKPNENDKTIDELLPQKDQALAIEFAHDSGNQAETEVIKESTAITTSQPLPLIASISPSPVIGANKRQGITIAGSHFNQETQLILNWEVNGEKKEKVFSVRLTPSQFKYENNKQIRLFVNTGVDAGEWQVQAVNSDNAHSKIVDFNVVKPFKAKISNIKKTEAKKKPSTKNYIAMQPNDYYTIQLLSSSNLAAVKDLRKKHKITDKSTIIPIKKDGKQLYSLVYGSFKNKKEASNAYQKLPRQLNKNRLWVRKIADIKGLMDPAQLSKVNNNKKASTSGKTKARNERFIDSQDPKLWTFQLISLGSVSDMKQYIRTNGIENGAHFFKRTVNGKTRYTLIYGVYKSRKQAQNQLASLPKNIRAGKPWIRQFADIKALMKN